MEQESIIYNIEKLAIHKVGNKANNEGLFLSNTCIAINDELNALLGNYFFKPFTGCEYYQFHHETNIDFNEVYQYALKIFEDVDTLHEHSINLAKLLFESSLHPKIKGGEFYVAYFKDCAVDGRVADAIGLFKSENKDTFLRVYPEGEDMHLEPEAGININKLDKGCIIYNTSVEEGCIVAVIDKTNKGSETVFWFDNFLQVKQRRDEYYQTENIISMCKEFVTKELPQHFEVNRADQADIIKKSATYLKENDNFNFEEFTNSVMLQPEVQEQFQNFRSNYESEHDIVLDDEFYISEAAVKRKQSALKTVIKLDKNFSVYVHGNTELMEHGVDDLGRKFYKLYYDNES